jgi:hypothetical protein
MIWGITWGYSTLCFEKPRGLSARLETREFLDLMSWGINPGYSASF